MLFRKNKKRKHTCCLCGMDFFNEYYGIKSYDDIPFYDFNFYGLHKQKCARCGLDFYYLIDLEKLYKEMKNEI